MKFFMLASCLFALTSTAFASCKDPMTQNEINMCAWKSANAEIVKMKKETAITLNLLKPNGTDTEFSIAQKAEISNAIKKSAAAFDALNRNECLIAADSFGGSLGSAEQASCLSKRAKERTKLILKMREWN